MVHFHLLGSFIIGKSRRSSQESRVPVWGAGEGGGMAILTSPSSPRLSPFSRMNLDGEWEGMQIYRSASTGAEGCGLWGRSRV